MFRVRSFENKTLTWWYQQRDDIDMSAPYQRRSQLWRTGDKALLMDSILNDYDIPKLYLADFSYLNSPLNLKRLPYAIIDGKQRFEAIFDFFEGDLVLNKRFVYDDQPDLALGGLSLRDLRANYPKIASKFEQFNLGVMSVITDDEAKINEMFVRLNRSKPLTGAEIRNAMSGSVPRLIRKLAQHRFFINCIRFSVKRGADLNTAAKLLLLEFRGEFVDTKRIQLDRFAEQAIERFVEEAVESRTSDFQRAARRTARTLTRMTKVFLPKDDLLKSQGPITLYYWLVRTFGPRPDLREFLVWFVESLRRNRVTAIVDPDSADSQLLSYDIMNRSTNDQGSLKGRFQILSERLEYFAKRRPSATNLR